MSFFATGMMVEEDDFPKNHQSQFSQNVGFAIYGQSRTLIVAATTVEEKEKWIRVRFYIMCKWKMDGHTKNFTTIADCHHKTVHGERNVFPIGNLNQE